MHAMGDIVLSEGDPEEGWVRASALSNDGHRRHGAGWILIDGTPLGLGRLIAPTSSALICELPQDVLPHILTQLKLSHVLNVRSSSRQLRALTACVTLWEEFARRRCVQVGAELPLPVSGSSIGCPESIP